MSPGLCDSLHLKGASHILLGDPEWRTVSGDLLVVDGKIDRVGGDLQHEADALGARTFSVAGLTLMPGFVQSHVHVCQTLFRGRAEGLSLLPWLRTRIWPFEAAHDPESLEASARLSVAELLLGGTTTILDMGTTHHHDVVFRVFEETGIRAASGKAMMDAGEGVPVGLLETTLDSLKRSFDLAETWDGRDDERLKYAFAPRFILACSDDLLREVVRLTGGKYLLHTHAAESPEEANVVERGKGRRNVLALAAFGFEGPKALLAHCVWVDDAEIAALASSGTRVLHCPRTNLKLGSGVAAVRRLMSRGVHVSVGADGAPANNTLDAFGELREAALLSSWKAGPGKLSAKEALSLLTARGAEALSWDHRIGWIRPGYDADLIAVDLNTPHAAPCPDPVTALVWSAKSSDVRHVFVRGEPLVEGGQLTRMNGEEVVRRAQAEALRLESRLTRSES